MGPQGQAHRDVVLDHRFALGHRAESYLGFGDALAVHVTGKKRQGRALHQRVVADGREAFVAFFEQMAKDSPGKSVAFKRVFADGNYVVLHSEHTFPGWRGGNWAAMDIFRLDDQGKIVEHWDALQKVPKKSANTNGMF